MVGANQVITTFALLAMLAFALVQSAKLPACHPQGHAAGTCIDSSKQCCPGGSKFVDGDWCAGHSNSPSVVCCSKENKPNKKTPPPKGKKTPPPKGKKVPPPKGKKTPPPTKGKKTPPPKKTPPTKAPKSKTPPPKTGGWTREDCAKVATSWLHTKPPIMFAERPTTHQYGKSGKGLYRSDCSGFTSACWNVPPPGWTTYVFKFHSVARKSLQRCDALLCRGCYHGIHHVALFWGWAKDGRPVIVEEYNYGHPVSMRAWDNSYFDHFMPIRRIGW